MRVLIETRMNSLKLNESKTPKKGCLGRLEGVCADFKNPTRNGRLYPLKLWKKVFEDNLFKESLDNKTLFGELDHPEDRFEPLISEACVVMTDYRIDEDKGLIYGGFDILDTPKGRILKSIVDYGSIVGVSSRGQGDIIESADGERVDEDSYEFACFDVVSTPAVAKARQNVMESIKRVKDLSFKESIKQQIDDAETVADLNIIRSVVRTSNIDDSEMDTIIESIEDRCNSLQKADETIVAKKTVEQPLNESAKTIRGNKQLYSCIRGLKSKVSAYKHREQRYNDMINESQDRISELEQSVRSLRGKLKESKRQYMSSTRSLDERVERTSRKLDMSNEVARKATSRNAQLREAVNTARQEVEAIKHEAHEAQINIRQKDSELNELREMLSKAEDRIKYFENKENLMEGKHSQEIKSLDNEVSEYSSLLQEAQDKLEAKTDTIQSLNESVNTLTNQVTKLKEQNDVISKQLNAYQNKYVKQVSTINGINPKSICESVSYRTSPEDVDKLVEQLRDKIDRHNKVPIISESNYSYDDELVVEGITSKHMTDEQLEDSRLYEFVLKTSKGI